MSLYKIDGSGIQISNVAFAEASNAAKIAQTAKFEKPWGARSNIIQTNEYSSPGTERWLESGLLFRRTSPATSFTFSWSVNITGTATKVKISCKGADTLSATHDYSGGEQSYTDTFSDATKLDSDTIALFLSIATENVEGSEFIGTARTLKLAAIPDGLELIGEYINRSPVLTVDSLTFDEAATYQTYTSHWIGKQWMAIGDSITQGVAPYYCKVAGQMLMMYRVTNAGGGGTSLVQWANSYLASAHYQGYDLVTIMHGVNDHDNSPNTPLGSLAPHGSSFDKSTFFGAYQFIIETIQASSPNTKIALLKSTYVSNDTWVNSEGLTMADYRAATQAVAESYGLPCFDASKIINAENNATMTSDGIHPTAEGQELLGLAIGEWLATV